MLHVISQRVRETLAIVAACVVCNASADTIVGGLIVQDTCWDLAGSPYIVSSQTIVGGDATLTIDAGVEVRVGAGLSLLVGSTTFGGATIVARGTTEEPISITSDSDTPAKGDWGQLILGEFLADGVADPDTGEYISGSIMEHCSIAYAGGAGAESGFRIFNCAPVLWAMTMHNIEGQGVLLYPRYGKAMRLRDWHIHDCGASNIRGGGLYIGGDERDVVFENCRFENNTAESGGGVYAYPETVVFRDCEFVGNSAVYFGGGVYAYRRFLQFENCLFDSNLSGREGGGLWAGDGNLTLLACQFLNNATVGGLAEGGGVYIDSGGNAIVDCLFQGNSAYGTSAYAYGGAIMHSGNGVGSVVDGCRFEDNWVRSNDATAGGGAAALWGTVDLLRSVFVGNSCIGETTSARPIGGALWFAGRLCEFNEFRDNTATGDDARGGAMYQEAQGVHLIGNSFESNSSAGLGGAVYILRRCSLAGDPLSRSANVFLSNEALLGTDIYNGVLFDANGDNDIDASYVCWGTDDPTEVEDRVYHFLDDGSKSVVGFLPLGDCSGGCRADFDGDGFINTQDFIAYLNVWAVGDPLADWNGDGTIDTRDFIAYLNDWVAGC